ncbi:GntR family transcriptional regulator [Gordonia sp. SL306]|uniref:GntR family transcriptional regulator n=1 Tax=Gordonia sp. SL306 TaxID=2995145 RepID=UPI002270B14B|nr:GntR family transcriptional regulator [Gordonia sp. SL306]WAC53846.1 GntR family transcriptional regulator [Gordonia sp. SL306]
MTADHRAGRELQMVPGDGTAGRPLRESIRDKLRERIIDGTYGPGDRIVERDVAADFGVSRLPVREALRMLDSEGFVEMLATRGVIVKKLSRRDVLELFDVREALEGLAFRRAAERLTKRDATHLGALRNKARKALEAADGPALHGFNEEFHDAVNRLARNDLLASILEPLEGRLHWIFRQNDRPDQLWREHEELLAAIVDRDGDRAADLAVAHVRVNRNRVLSHLFGDHPEGAAAAG